MIVRRQRDEMSCAKPTSILTTTHYTAHKLKNRIALSRHRNVEGIPNTQGLTAVSVSCLAIGFIVRFFYLLVYPVPVRDSFKYMMFIESWLETGEYPTNYPFPPLSVYLLKLPHELCNCDLIRSGIVVNMVLGLLIIVLIIKISSNLNCSICYSTCLGLIAATHPTLVHYSCQVLRENSFLFFCCLSVLSMISYLKKHNIIYYIASSFFIVSSCLCRYEAMELIVVLGVVILFLNKEKKRKKVLLLFVFFLIAITAVFIISCAIGVPLDYYCKALTREIEIRKI